MVHFFKKNLSQYSQNANYKSNQFEIIQRICFRDRVNRFKLCNEKIIYYCMTKTKIVLFV